MQRTDIINTLLNIAFVCGIVAALTSCGGGNDHNSAQLAELNIALLQVETKEQADRAALAQAQAGGASASTVAALQQAIALDDAEEAELGAFILTTEGGEGGKGGTGGAGGDFFGNGGSGGAGGFGSLNTGNGNTGFF